MPTVHAWDVWMDKDDVWRVLLSAWDTVRSAGQANLAQLRRGRNVGNGRCIPTLARASNRWTAGFFVCRQGLHETIPPFTKRGPSHTSLKSRHVHRSRSNGRGEALPLSLRRGDKTGEPRATKELDGCHGCPAASTTNGTLDPVPANDSRTSPRGLPYIEAREQTPRGNLEGLPLILGSVGVSDVIPTRNCCKPTPLLGTDSPTLLAQYAD